MKKINIFKTLGIIVLAVVIGFSMVSCGGAKSLAKQSYEITKQAQAAIADTQKAAKLMEKAEAIQEKVDKLSEKDQEIYAAELSRLMSGR
jgi:hypothetical protein